jgi:hypothetical protein
MLPRPDRGANVAGGMILLAGGTVGVAEILAAAREGQSVE